MIKNVISVIDGAAGSCGKAKVVGEIATDQDINLGASVTNCMPNAGHTFTDERGNKTVFRNIPVSIINPKTELFIGPGSAIDMGVFQDEYSRVSHLLKGRKIYVHEMVPIIEERHKKYEREHIETGSTFKGCGSVSSEKVLRDKKLEFFKTFKDAVVCSNYEWLERLYSHLDNPFEYVLLEGAQGCDLSLNHSGNYPYVTSRNVSTAQLLADCGIPAERLLQTIMVIRPFPIRISNITNSGKVIYSGAYGQGDELTWSQINLASMFGGYPTKDDIEYYPKSWTVAKLKKIIAHCPKEYLIQVLGKEYKARSLNSLSILEALELERLMYKSKGQTEYETKLIEIEMFSQDLPKNTIIDQSENTTVTQMERRVFDLDIAKLKMNCRINNPSSLYLNFFQHLDLNYKEKCGNFEDYYFNRYLREYLSWLESNTKTPISALGTGPENNARILKFRPVKDIDH